MAIKKFYTVSEIYNMISDINRYKDNINNLRNEMKMAKDGYNIRGYTISVIELLINQHEKQVLETKYILDKIFKSNVTEHKEELLEDLMLFSNCKIKGDKKIYMKCLQFH
jgi:hypothetical protein